jgi:pimeloyl-ACP methyl ester carboxylesterase
LASAALATSACSPYRLAADVILRPMHRAVSLTPSIEHRDLSFAGDGVRLRGWVFDAEAPRCGTIVFLHGRNQNREAGLPLAERLVPLGYEVVAYDSRAHGESGGIFSTFGYFERKDVSRALDAIGADRVILVGVSLGAAVALQAAAEDPRVAGVVSVSGFSSMEQVIRDRFPPFVPEVDVQAAFREVEREAGMRVEDADVVAAARRIEVPVLLLHGSDDRFVPPVHSVRIFQALRGPREIVIVRGAGHSDVLRHEEGWAALRGWLERRGCVSARPLTALRR